jgi:Flavodoxin
MRAVVVYESMYGNTHAVAKAIGEGIGPVHSVTVVPVERADRQLVEHADLVVVGGPTHAHGVSRERTRKAAVAAAAKAASTVALDPDAQGLGLREWFASLGILGARAAAFDTRLRGPAGLTGRASKSISRQLRRHGCTLVAEPNSFFVTKENHLRAGEEDRARAWGQSLSASGISSRPAVLGF